MKPIVTFFFLIYSFGSFSQIVEEIIPIDTASITCLVIYRPTLTRQIFSKKIAVFADDTSVVAVAKNYAYDYLNGIYKAYYPSGELMIFANYANNKLNGDWTLYDKEGSIVVKGRYKNDIKHGFWAYRKEKCYGRYKKGVEKGRWKCKDHNGMAKIIKFKKGQDLQLPITGIHLPMIKDTNTSATKKANQQPIAKQLPPEYQQAIQFLRENFVLRKTIRSHYTNSLRAIRQFKKHYKNSVFQFIISPDIITLPINSFIENSKKGEIEVAAIDSILKKEDKKLSLIFNGELVKKDNELYNYSTNTSAAMVVYFSEIHQGLLRIDVIKHSEPPDTNDFEEQYRQANENQFFRILLYFNEQKVLKGAAYQKE